MFGLVRQARLESLESQVAQLQHSLNLSLPDSTVTSTDYVGNKYRTYKEQVKETSERYEGTAAWGVQPTKNIIDLRATMTLGEGVEVQVAAKDGEEDAKKELDYLNRFIDENGLDGATALEWAVEAEIEGKILVKITVDDEKAQSIAARFIPWTVRKYTVKTATDDYKDFLKITWEEFTPAGGGSVVQAGSLSPEEFVYMKFGGRAHKVNETPTKVGSVLTQIESVDRALRDWREISYLFASPTPFVSAETKEEAEAAHAALTDANWKIGKLLVLGNADFTMVGIDSAGIDALEKEIVRLTSLISGAISIPVHFLGLPELMSNRATADNLMEVLFAGVSREREVWTSGYTTLFRKVLELANDKFAETEGSAAKFDPRKIVANIPQIGIVRLQQLVDVWLELFNASAISRKSLLERVPGIDVEAELKRIDDEKEADTPDVFKGFGLPGANGGANPVKPPIQENEPANAP